MQGLFTESALISLGYTIKPVFNLQVRRTEASDVTPTSVSAFKYSMVLGWQGVCVFVGGGVRDGEAVLRLHI